MLVKILLLVVAVSTFALAAQAQQSLIAVNYISASTDSVGVYVSANYFGQCPSRPVSAQIYVQDATGAYQFNGAFLINPAWNTYDGVHLTDTNVGYGQFKVPRTSNPSNSILLRLWKSTADCSKFANEIGQVGPDAYQDYFVNGYTPANYYYGLNNPSGTPTLVTMERTSYKIKLDRNGGTTYEFYNKRATLNGAPFIANAVHPNVGAALQIAIQHSKANGGQVSSASCDPNQGYWNPTQAGNFCNYLGGIGSAPSTPSVKCDGVLTTTCTVATNTLEIGEHTMRNWDYGNGYIGPLNSGDTAKLKQLVTAQQNFVEYDITLRNDATTARNGVFIELPTFYFPPAYRRWYAKHVAATQVQNHTIPDRLDNQPMTPSNMGLTISDYNPGTDYYNHEDISWITFENTKGNINDAITISWFYKPNFRTAIAMPGYGYTISEQAITRTLKFSNLPTFNLQPGVTYQFKYVIFPFRYDEVIASPYGTKPVKDVIASIKLAYEM